MQPLLNKQKHKHPSTVLSDVMLETAFGISQQKQLGFERKPITVYIFNMFLPEE